MHIQLALLIIIIIIILCIDDGNASLLDAGVGGDSHLFVWDGVSSHRLTTCTVIYTVAGNINLWELKLILRFLVHYKI